MLRGRRRIGNNSVVGFEQFDCQVVPTAGYGVLDCAFQHFLNRPRVVS